MLEGSKLAMAALCASLELLVLHVHQSCQVPDKTMPLLSARQGMYSMLQQELQQQQKSRFH
eukprot:12864331-Ditylum_brightwellii.AAC.1